MIRCIDLIKINECGKSSLQKSSCVGLSRAGLSHWRKDNRRHSPHCACHSTQIGYGHPASGEGLQIDARRPTGKRVGHEAAAPARRIAVPDQNRQSRPRPGGPARSRSETFRTVQCRIERRTEHHRGRTQTPGTWHVFCLSHRIGPKETYQEQLAQTPVRANWTIKQETAIRGEHERQAARTPPLNARGMTRRHVKATCRTVDSIWTATLRCAQPSVTRAGPRGSMPRSSMP